MPRVRAGGFGWGHRHRRHQWRSAGRDGTLTLDRVKRGTRVRVVRVLGGTRLSRRLAALGIVRGAVLSVTRDRGPAILSLDGLRVALGRGAARAVEVEEAGE